MSKRKYKPGCHIVSLDVLMKQEFVYCAGKLLHRGWFGSWQLRYANDELSRMRVRKAIKINEEEVKKHEQEKVDRCRKS